MKIKILLLINDMYINNFKTIYDECQKSNIFEMIVVACPSQATAAAPYISSKKIKKYIEKNNIKCIDSYDSKNHEYIDLRKYKPDYIFVSTPYDFYRPSIYSSFNLAKIAKLCDIEYGACLIKYKGAYNSFINDNYTKNAYKKFCTNILEITAYPKETRNFAKNKYVPIGNIKVDQYLYYGEKANSWDKYFNKTNDSLRIVWKPRWAMEDDNCIFEYMKGFYKLLLQNSNYQLLILVHPLLISNLKYKNKYNNFLKLYHQLLKLNNCNYCDADNFLDVVLDSDVLVSEASSIMAEYTITNNPIIYVKTNLELNEYGKLVMENNYTIDSFMQLKTILSKIKKNTNKNYSNDKLLNTNSNTSATYKLLEYLKEDYISTNYNADYFRNMAYENQLTYENDVKLIGKMLIDGYYQEIKLKSNDPDLQQILNSIKYWSNTIASKEKEIMQLKSSKWNKIKFLIKKNIKKKD